MLHHLVFLITFQPRRYRLVIFLLLLQFSHLHWYVPFLLPLIMCILPCPHCSAPCTPLGSSLTLMSTFSYLFHNCSHSLRVHLMRIFLVLFFIHHFHVHPAWKILFLFEHYLLYYYWFILVTIWNIPSCSCLILIRIFSPVVRNRRLAAMKSLPYTYVLLYTLILSIKFWSFSILVNSFNLFHSKTDSCYSKHSMSVFTAP